MARWGDLPKASVQLQFEEGTLVTGEDTVVPEKIMTANITTAQAVQVNNRAQERCINRHNANMKKNSAHACNYKTIDLILPCTVGHCT